MSFELYLQVFKNGDEYGFTPQRVRSAFGECLAELEPDFWQVRYSDTESSDLFLSSASDAPSVIHNVSVHRPCNDGRLWEALYNLLEAPGSLFYLPGCSAPLTRDPSVAEALPPGMIDDLGQPQLAKSAADLSRAVASA